MTEAEQQAQKEADDAAANQEQVNQPQPGDVVAPPTDQTNDTTEMQDVTVDGYTFSIDKTLLDDVEVLEALDSIENKQKPEMIITLLKRLVGDDGYAAMKAYFVQKDGRLKISELTKIFEAIFENFDPKG